MEGDEGEWGQSLVELAHEVLRPLLTVVVGVHCLVVPLLDALHGDDEVYNEVEDHPHHVDGHRHHEELYEVKCLVYLQESSLISREGLLIGDGAPEYIPGSGLRVPV